MRRRLVVLGSAFAALAIITTLPPGTPVHSGARHASTALQVDKGTVGGNTLQVGYLASPQNPGVSTAGSCYSLNWVLPSGMDGSKVNRSNDGGVTWKVVATIPAPTTTYKDCEPGPGAKYSITSYRNNWESTPPSSDPDDKTVEVVDAPPLTPEVTWTEPVDIIGIASASAPASDGNFYITTTGGNLIKMTPQGVATVITAGLPRGIHGTVLAKDGYLYATTTDGKFLKIGLDGKYTLLRENVGNLITITQADDGYFYVAANAESRIYRFDSKGNFTEFARVPAAYGITHKGGNFWVTSYSTGTISKVTSTGEVTTIATGFASSLTGITLASNGWLYTVEYGTGKVYKVSSTGARTLVATLQRPWGIVQGSDAYFYITDPVNGIFTRIKLA